MVDTLEAKRQSLMRETYDVIQNLVDDLIQDQHCNSLCSSALIGCFMRQIRSTGIDGLDWGGDIRGCSVQCLCDLVSGFTTPELVIEHGPNGSLRSKVHLCSVSKKLAEYGFLPAAKVSENLGVEALGYPSDD